MSDLFNLTLVESSERVDEINKEFYGKFNYPWQAFIFPAYPAGMASLFINQDVGYYRERRLPAKMKIWVAGCGTNQALFTALKFPEAEVLGTDLSTNSLQACKRNADQIGVTNLRLEEKSLNDVPYDGEFDYLICTGVIHHNAAPRETLKRLSRALKKDGILELMVYNYYHRLVTTACQKAIRTFYRSSGDYDIKREIALLRRIMADFPGENILSNHLKDHVTYPEASIADSFLQPVEYSYTVESLEQMAASCHLDYLNPCLNQFDIDGNHLSWNMNFSDPELRGAYLSLPDAQRWQISNLLMFNESPMLWFYFQRKDSSFKRKDEQQICQEFLETHFSPGQFQLQRYILGEHDKYSAAAKGLDVRSMIPDDRVIRSVVQDADLRLPMKDVFKRLNLRTDFHTVNDIRLRTTTMAFPFLQAVRD